MSQKFDPMKPHNHRCNSCHKKIHCRANPCAHPQFIECIECQEGATMGIYKGEYVIFRNHPVPLHQIDYEDDD